MAFPVSRDFPYLPSIAICMVAIFFLQLLACDDDRPLGEEEEPTHQRIVTLGGPITEIVFALGGGEQVVALDASSEYPEEAMALPKLDYFRNVSAEGVLEQRPTLILASQGVGPRGVEELWKQAGVKVHIIDEPTTAEEAAQRIEKIAGILGREEAFPALQEALLGPVEEARIRAAALENRPRVLMLYARGAGTLMVGGKGTGAAEMIREAGGDLAVDFEGFRPLGAEGIIAARPDVVIMTKKGLESLGTAEQIWALDGMALTPAGENQRLLAVDDLPLLGYGPRMGEALLAMTAYFEELSL